jgi:hypothetical protein
LLYASELIGIKKVILVASLQLLQQHLRHLSSLILNLRIVQKVMEVHKTRVCQDPEMHLLYGEARGNAERLGDYTASVFLKESFVPLYFCGAFM